MDEQVLDNNTFSLFEGEGEINEDDLEELEIELAANKLPGKGREAFGTRQECSFSIGNPVFLPLQKFLELTGQADSSVLQSEMKKYEFCPVELACSFGSGGGYRFHDACFKIALQTLPAHSQATTSTVVEQAIAYSLFPLGSEDESNQTTTKGGTMKATVGPVSGEIPFSQKTHTGIGHVNYIHTFGLRTTQPEWRFTRTPFREIEGSYLLRMLVKKPKGTKVQATFSLTAHLEFVVGPTPLKTLLSVLMRFRRSDLSATIIDHPTASLC